MYMAHLCTSQEKYLANMEADRELSSTHRQSLHRLTTESFCRQRTKGLDERDGASVDGVEAAQQRDQTNADQRKQGHAEAEDGTATGCSADEPAAPRVCEITAGHDGSAEQERWAN